MLDVALTHRLGAFALDVAFHAGAGVTAILGRSGAGKTTLVNAIAGLITPDQGHIKLDQTDLLDTAKGINRPPHQRHLGYVFQDGRLFPHLTVAQNLDFGLRYAPAPLSRSARSEGTAPSRMKLRRLSMMAASTRRWVASPERSAPFALSCSSRRRRTHAPNSSPS